MATQLDTIYNKFLTQIDDIELSLLEEGDLQDLLMDCLENATVEFKECKKDLSIVKPYKQVYTLTNGEVLSINTLLDENTKITVRDDYREYKADVDYKINSNRSACELSLSPLAKSKGTVKVTVSNEGAITDDLTLEEIYILSLCMKLFWLSSKVYREENLRQMMNDRDFKQLSNANMLKVLLQLQTATRQELQKFKQRYAMKDFKGFN